MNQKMYMESSFQQSANNVEKFGAYYTDPGHCRRIGNLFDFSEADEVCVLEPSAGDGAAVRSVTKGQANCRIFAVEIQEKTCKEHLEGNGAFTAVLNEDFLRGVKISHGVFSFCFANPPYGESREEAGSKRLELLFLEKISAYLKAGAYLAMVVPFYVFSSEKFLRAVMNRYEVCSFYRFDDKVYARFHQVVAVLRRKKGSAGGYLRSSYEEMSSKVSKLEDYPYLPAETDEVERYNVLPSYERNIEYFTGIKFRPEEAAGHLGDSSLFSFSGELFFQKEYRGCSLNTPIVPVSKDIAYLLAVSGGGQGFAGNVEDGTLHLQRGVIKHVDENSLRKDEEGKAVSVVSTSFTKTGLNIIENDGRITQL